MPTYYFISAFTSINNMKFVSKGTFTSTVICSLYSKCANELTRSNN